MNGVDKEISIPKQTPISVVPVTSLGNSWIICRSKSYAGRVYYFNTLTGEAVWNLSETEKAIAKKKTLESQSEIGNTEFPEPLESPNDENPKYTAPARIYNKQIINNQFSRLPYSIPNVNFEPCTPVNAFNAIGLGIPYTPFINVSSNPIILTQPTKYDTNSSINTKYEIPKNTRMFNTSIPLSMRFQYIQNCSRFPNRKFMKKSFKRKIHHDHNLLGGHTDLRNKLSNLRTMKESQDNAGRTSGINNSHTFTCDSEVRFEDEILNNEEYTATDDSMVTDLVDEFSDVGMNYNLPAQCGKQSHTHGTMDDYDFHITPLKALFEINAKTKLWFLVVDEDVLFSNLNFISKLIRLDNKCRLIFPKVVLNEVQKATTSIERTKSRRSLQAAVFISKMLSENRAVIDKFNHNTNEYCKNIIDCCLNLSRKDFKVVLITEKDSLKDCNINSFCIFTINDLKYFFTYGKLKDTPLQEDTLPTLQNDEKSTITITIHNNDVREESLQEDREDASMNYESDILPKNKDMCVQTENVSHLVDAGVQTESYEDYPTANSSNQTLVSKESEEIHQIRTATDRRYSKWRRRNINIKDSSGVIVNKTATSESKTLPNNDQNSGIDQENFLYAQNADDDVVTNNNDGNVMFEVSSKAMEEYLEMKSDEWVSRFIQIMEEALTQILQLDSPLVSDMPPPWTIYEASECIKRQFCNEPDVVDAANKLGDILFEIGGLRGKINKYVTPKCYMKLYSYGVYLIDALQGPMSNNEDLHIAAKSLAKLLSDIQEPHLDSSYYDSFTDIDAPTLSESNASNNKDINKNSQETGVRSNSVPVVNVTTPSKDLSDRKISRAPSVIEDNNQEQPSIKTPRKQTPMSLQRTSSLDHIIEKTPKSQCEKVISPQLNISSPIKYLLRNRKNNQKEPEHNFVRNLSPKQNFLKNFNLLNVVEDNAIVETPSPQTNSDDDNENGRNQVENEKTNHDEYSPNLTTSGPKIIRNFTRCVEFEERLQRKCDFYSEEFSDEEYDDAYLEGSNMSYYEDMDFNESGLDSDSVVNDKSVKNVKACKSLIGKIGAHTKENFQLIFSFCKDSRKQLLSKCDESEKLKIQMKAKEVSIFMDDFCLDLKRIYKRETCESQEGVRHFLVKLGLEGNEIDEQELELYRSFINECIIQGANLQNTLKLLIEATQEM